MDGALTTLRSELADRYEVEQELGHGGMAVVYLAKDLKHDRRVAIKMLRQDVGGASAERFLREIRTVAQLHHPHILQLLDSGTAADHLFYVMPYVEGETVRQRLEREGPLPIDEAVRIACEVADALAFAHARGIVHRDIKPENVFLSAGHALVADFGIARATDAAGTTLTDVGLAVGTPTYMSPEQATADPRVDGRSDQYALGCVLYEMLAGAPPFTGPTSQAIMARHTADPVPPLRTVREVPAALESAITRALSKMPADRWPSVNAFADRLEGVNAVQSVAAAPPGLARASRWLLGGATAAAVVFMAWRLSGRETASSDIESVRSLAVTPFVLRGDTTYSLFAEGLADGVAAGLVRVDGISVKSASVMFGYHDRAEDPLGIGRDLGVDVVVTAVVQAVGNRLRVTPRLLKVEDGAVLWGGDPFDGEVEAEGRLLDLFDIQDSITVRIVAALKPQLEPRLRAVAARGVQTRDLEAYSLYQQARTTSFVLTRESLERTLDLLNRVIVRDSSFADAWAAKSRTIFFLREFGAETRERQVEARDALERAIALDSLNGIALSERAWVRAEHWDWDGAWTDMRRSVQIAPGSPEVALNYAGFLRWVSEPDSSLTMFRRALTLDATNATTWQGYANLLRQTGKRDSAFAAIQRSLALDSTLWYAHMTIGSLYDDIGRHPEAQSAYATALRFSGDSRVAIGRAEDYFRRTGNLEKADSLLSRLKTMPHVSRTPIADQANERLRIGDASGALDALERAVNAAEPDVAMLLIGLRSKLAGNPRYDAAARRVFGARPVPRVF